MKNTIDKSIKMLSELTAYFYKLGATCLDIETCNDNSIKIKISGKTDNFTSSDLEDINRVLSVPRLHEIEEYYWELNGDFHSSSELSLLGMMIDHFEINYKNNLLTISVERYN